MHESAKTSFGISLSRLWKKIERTRQKIQTGSSTFVYEMQDGGEPQEVETLEMLTMQHVVS